MEAGSESDAEKRSQSKHPRRSRLGFWRFPRSKALDWKHWVATFDRQCWRPAFGGQHRRTVIRSAAHDIRIVQPRQLL